MSWGVDLSECSRIWKGGCIIRAGFLDRLQAAYTANPQLVNLMVDPGFAEELSRRLEAHGIPTTVFHRDVDR